MLSMLRLLIIIAIATNSLLAKTIEEKVKSFEKRRINSNRSLKVKKIDIVFKKNLKDGWSGYIFDLVLNVKGKKIKTKDMLFSNGTMITPELRILKNGFSLKNLMYPSLDNHYYKLSHLIAGNKNAKHKLVVFSDPLCPNCVDLMPELIMDVQKNPKILSLYYISFPLDMHPTAKTIAKATKIAKKLGIKNIDYKVYTAKFEDHFNPYKNKDDKKTLKIFNKLIKTNITMKQINSKDIKKEIQSDIDLSEKAFVNGTPTLFTDGEIDITRNRYREFIK